WFFNATPNYWTERINMTIESDSVNVYVRLINFDTTRTIYYRVSGLVPPTATLSDILLPSSKKSFTFNTDDNYMKLFYNQITTHSIPTFGIDTVYIDHNLGYKPTILLFTED